MRVHAHACVYVCVNSVGCASACADLESFARGGPTLTTFFDGGKRIQIVLKAGYYRPASEMPNAGLVALSFFRGSGLVLLRNSIFL